MLSSSCRWHFIKICMPSDFGYLISNIIHYFYGTRLKLKQDCMLHSTLQSVFPSGVSDLTSTSFSSNVYTTWPIQYSMTSFTSRLQHIPHLWRTRIFRMVKGGHFFGHAKGGPEKTADQPSQRNGPLSPSKKWYLIEIIGNCITIFIVDVAVSVLVYIVIPL